MCVRQSRRLGNRYKKGKIVVGRFRFRFPPRTAPPPAATHCPPPASTPTGHDFPARQTAPAVWSRGRAEAELIKRQSIDIMIRLDGACMASNACQDLGGSERLLARVRLCTHTPQESRNSRVEREPLSFGLTASLSCTPATMPDYTNMTLEDYLNSYCDQQVYPRRRTRARPGLGGRRSPAAAALCSAHVLLLL